jgi:N utilization substance protein A
MPAIQRSEFALALNQVATERGVDISVVLDTVKNAILAAYRKDHPGIEIEEYQATLNPNTGEAKILHNEEDVTPPGFGRIAAQTAKQVILQKIREREKEAILSDYKVKIGTIGNGMVLRFAGSNIVIDIGKAEGLMPQSEQIQNEKYYINQRLTVYLLEIKEGTRGEEVIVSRANNGLIEGLFKREVPEIAQGSVIIKAIAREAGNRSKIAVFSNQSGIDPVGSCVGQKGVRVQAIIQEFGGLEKIDIIQWSDDPKTYIAQSLSPVKNLRVVVDDDSKIAHVFVDKKDLSLAIGKDGQNVRLASKLTGYRIEIEAEAGSEDAEEPAVAESKEAKATEVKASETTEKKSSKTKKKEEIQSKAEESTEEKPAETEKVEAKELTAASETQTTDAPQASAPTDDQNQAPTVDDKQEVKEPEQPAKEEEVKEPAEETPVKPDVEEQVAEDTSETEASQPAEDAKEQSQESVQTEVAEPAETVEQPAQETASATETQSEVKPEEQKNETS